MQTASDCQILNNFPSKPGLHLRWKTSTTNEIDRVISCHAVSISIMCIGFPTCTQLSSAGLHFSIWNCIGWWLFTAATELPSKVLSHTSLARKPIQRPSKTSQMPAIRTNPRASKRRFHRSTCIVFNQRINSIISYWEFPMRFHASKSCSQGFGHQSCEVWPLLRDSLEFRAHLDHSTQYTMKSIIYKWNPHVVADLTMFSDLVRTHRQGERILSLQVVWALHVDLWSWYYTLTHGCRFCFSA